LRKASKALYGRKNFRLIGIPFSFSTLEKQPQWQENTLSGVDLTTVPWFPTKVEELNLIGKKDIDDWKGLVGESHPGYHEEAFRVRRQEVCRQIQAYSMLDKELPRIMYTEGEKKIWEQLYSSLKDFHKAYACQ